AAQAYFGKDVGELTLAESALLAGFIPAPSVSDPIEHPQRAADRYRYVVTRLRDLDWIDDARAAKLLRNQPEVTPRAKPETGPAPYFMAMVEAELADRLGDQVYRGLTVKTTLDSRLQRIAEKTYKRHFNELRKQFRAELGKKAE